MLEAGVFKGVAQALAADGLGAREAAAANRQAQADPNGGSIHLILGDFNFLADGDVACRQLGFFRGASSRSCPISGYVETDKFRLRSSVFTDSTSVMSTRSAGGITTASTSSLKFCSGIRVSKHL